MRVTEFSCYASVERVAAPYLFYCIRASEAADRVADRVSEIPAAIVSQCRTRQFLPFRVSPHNRRVRRGDRKLKWAIALVQTTYTNPVRTTKMAGLLTALERPIIVPLLHLTIWLSPLLWLSNWMSYLNGSALLSTKSSGFAGTETLEELNFVARFQLQASPAVMARGMFGMLRYDATASLKDINVPALILAGDRDPVCTPEASERMQRDIPGAQLTKLVPARHMGLIEHHTHFAEILRKFASLSFQYTSPIPNSIT